LVWRQQNLLCFSKRKSE